MLEITFDKTVPAQILRLGGGEETIPVLLRFEYESTYLMVAYPNGDITVAPVTSNLPITRGTWIQGEAKPFKESGGKTTVIILNASQVKPEG